MRVAFGLVGLALSVVAIGACEEPHYKDADAVTCMAYLALQSTAVSEGRMTGDATVLDMNNLSEEQRRLFAPKAGVQGLPTPQELGTALLEPHASWMTRIVAEWEKRYSR